MASVPASARRCSMNPREARRWSGSHTPIVKFGDRTPAGSRPPLAGPSVPPARSLLRAKAPAEEADFVGIEGRVGAADFVLAHHHACGIKQLGRRLLPDRAAADVQHHFAAGFPGQGDMLPTFRPQRGMRRKSVCCPCRGRRRRSVGPPAAANRSRPPGPRNRGSILAPSCRWCAAKTRSSRLPLSACRPALAGSHPGHRSGGPSRANRRRWKPACHPSWPDAHAANRRWLVLDSFPRRTSEPAGPR